VDVFWDTVYVGSAIANIRKIFNDLHLELSALSGVFKICFLASQHGDVTAHDSII